jgi:hypothetical protein
MIDAFCWSTLTAWTKLAEKAERQYKTDPTF